MWIPLHVHSQYSILDSTISIQEIVKKAKSFDIPAIALTDRGNMHGIVDFYKACKSQGIKPILGCEVYLASPSRLEKKSSTAYPLILLAKNEKGYKNLCKLSSIGYVEGFYYRPRIDREMLEKYHEGLICLSGPLSGPIASSILQGNDEKTFEEVLWYQKVFQEDFYLELQRHRMTEENIQKDGWNQEDWVLQKYLRYVKEQEFVIEKLIEISEKFSIPCVATNDIHYSHRDDWKAHEILLNIQSGEPCEIWELDSLGNQKTKIPNPKRKIYSSHEFFFKSPQEMDLLFSDFSKAIENTLSLADKCSCSLDFDTKHYPVFLPPNSPQTALPPEERQKAANDYLYLLCQKAIPQKYHPEQLLKVKKKHPDHNPLEVVQKRLDYEFQIIVSKGMCDYLLIVYDFISWAKSQRIFVGPGRGSAAGSILCFLLGITDIEPLQFHLFFERFINPERFSYPDIDVDICMERRPEVIEYTLQKYGKEKVAQIITFGTMKAKMAIKDVGRVLSVPLSKVNAIAKLIPEDLNITLKKALEVDVDLKNFYDQDEEVKKIIDCAKEVEGSIRNTSTHAAGMIISADPVTDHVPICTAKDSQMIVTQYAMKPIEAVGMLKIDLLGLKTLTSIQKTIEFIEKKEHRKIDWDSLPLEDKKTFELLNQGKTLGVFQLESSGMQELAKQLHIDHFEEIIAVGALYRPGPMDMIPSFIQRKHGKEPIEIDHPFMKEILEETYGVMVYQEQVMQIASKLAGYTLGEGDVLRRAMGKKDRGEMERQRTKFLQGCIANKIEEATATRVFEKIEKFASYGFNKSHATAYAYLSYVTAYLKANYPSEWMASLMTCDRDDVSKISKFIRECQSMNIPILPPDVNEAGVEFLPTAKGIRFAMTGIKGIGQGVVEAILEERSKKGLFKSLYDFIRRVDTTRVGKKNIEILIEAGAFDFTQISRTALKQQVDRLYENAVKEKKEQALGILNLFSLWDQETPIAPCTKEEKAFDISSLQREKELLGFYLTGHPLQRYKKNLKNLSCVPLKNIEQFEHGSVCRCALIIDDIKIKIATKTQKKFAVLTVSDGVDQQEIPIWSDLYEEKSFLLKENQLLYALLQIDKKDSQLKIHCSWLTDLTKVNEETIRDCDLAYDQTKDKFSKKNKKTFVKKNTLSPAKKTAILVKLSVDADQIKLSQILHLKELFRSHPGNTPVEIIFLSQEKPIGILQIEARWGVTTENLFEEKIRKVSAVKELKVL